MAAAASVGLGGAGAEGDEAPEGPLPSLRGGEAAQLSAYERKRLKNISENARFFASLKLFESAARLRKMTLKRKTPGIKRVKSPKAETKTTCRRSMRLQRIDPLGIPLPEPEAKLESPMEEEHARLPPGPHPMVATVQEPKTDTFLSMWAKISQVEGKKSEKSSCNLESYKIHLRGMVLREEHVAKVVKSRIYSVAVHPSESRTLVAAGDKWGEIGLWDLDYGLENGTHVFIPHSQAVSCLHFSPVNPAHLLSLSHDGTIRSGDVTQRIFEEIYRNESYSLSSFDFLASNASTLVVGMWDGRVAIVDRRTPVPSPEISVDLHSKTRTVHVHPISRQYFVAAGERNVNIYDARHLKSKGQPVLALSGHTKSVASAYFSPVTGNRVVTTCADDTLRIFGTQCLSSLAPILTTIRHNNNTGRWLTRFRAVWDPKRDDCFVVGSMTRPRQIHAFHATGELLHSFLKGVASVLEKVNSHVEEVAEKVDIMEGKIESMEKEMENEILMLQYGQMEYALRIRGLAESLQGDLKEMVAKDFALILNKEKEGILSEIEKLFRVNSVVAVQKNLPRDVVIYFGKRSLRNEIVQAYYKKRFQIASQDVIIFKEIPSKILRRRKEFAFLVNELKKRKILFRWDVPTGMVVNYLGTCHRLNTVSQAKDFYTSVLGVCASPSIRSQQVQIEEQKTTCVAHHSKEKQQQKKLKEVSYSVVSESLGDVGPTKSLEQSSRVELLPEMEIGKSQFEGHQQERNGQRITCITYNCKDQHKEEFKESLPVLASEVRPTKSLEQSSEMEIGKFQLEGHQQERNGQRITCTTFNCEDQHKEEFTEEVLQVSVPETCATYKCKEKVTYKCKERDQQKKEVEEVSQVLIPELVGQPGFTNSLERSSRAEFHAFFAMLAGKRD